MAFILRRASAAIAQHARPLAAAVATSSAAAAVLASQPGPANTAMASRAYCSDDIVRLPPSHAQISRLLLPDDANPAGNVHGGTILNLVDQAGWAAATRFVNQSDGPPAIASLARLEHVDFRQPVFIGEIAHVDANVTYTSEHSIEVEVTVTAENMVTGTKRLTNKARAWYVARAFDPKKMQAVKMASFMKSEDADYFESAVVSVPKLQYKDDRDEELGLQRYMHQKQRRHHTQQHRHDDNMPEHGDATLIHVILPSDCNAAGYAQAGSVMKLMDNAAGVVAVRHCRTNVVTASLEAVDFCAPVTNGDIIEIHARPVFTSAHSMDIEVNVYSQNLRRQERMLTNSSIFTFVSLDENRKPQPVPQFVPETEEEKRKFEEGARRYQQRKAMRQAALERAAAAKASKATEQQARKNTESAHRAGPTPQ